MASALDPRHHSALHTSYRAHSSTDIYPRDHRAEHVTTNQDTWPFSHQSSTGARTMFLGARCQDVKTRALDI